MSNLSELLPAGAGAKSAEFVASGTLGSGVTVALKSDGTVEAVAETSVAQNVGTSQTTTANPRVMSSAYDSAQEKTVIVYADSNNSSYGTAVVVTTTGSTVSLGTPQVFESFNIGGGSRPTATVYDENSGKIVICYIQANTGIGVYNGKAIVGTVSGTSISFGSSTDVDTSNNINYFSAAYDSINNKVVVCYRDENSSNRGEAKVGTVSGNSISFGGVTVFNGVTTSYISTTFDPDTGKIIVGFRSSNNYGTSIVGTVGGTSIGFGSQVVFNSGTTSTIATSYDSTNNKVVIAYQKADGTSYGAAKVGTVSGTSISFGTEAVFSTTALYSLTGNSFDANSGKVIIAYGTTTAYTEKAICGLVSGTGISFTDAVIDLPNSGGNGVTVTYDASALISVVGLQATSTNLGVATIQPAYSSTNSADFIGITDQAIADTATGAVIVQGGVSDKLSGLTVGADYYVQADGSISSPTVAIPYDISGAAFIDSFSVAAQDSEPTGVTFNTDGTRMFVVGEGSDNVNQYTLSTGFDVSSSSFSSSFSLSSRQTQPKGLTFNSNGTKMYIVGSDGTNIDEYNLGTAFTVTTSVYSQSFSVSAQDTNPTGIVFNTDGTKMYIVGDTGDDINEYGLSTGFDISTASFTQSFSVAAQETSPEDVAFNSNGTKMFVIGRGTNAVKEYNLSTAFDISTSIFSQSFDVSAQETQSFGIAFSSDGTKMFIVGRSGDDVNEYSSTAFGTISSVPAGRALSSTSILLEG